MTGTSTGLERLRSECGRYLVERIDGDGLRYRLYDRAGNFLGETTFWINLLTSSRARFRTGFGPHEAIFSYPRYPRWFRRRWVECFDIWIDELKSLIEGCGCKVLTGWKPDLNCWNHVGFRATSGQVRRVDGELVRRGVRWNGPPARLDQWDIGCPRS